MIIANKVRINSTNSEVVKVRKNEVKEMRLVAIEIGRRI